MTEQGSEDIAPDERDRTIGRQSEATRELLTPVLQIREGLLLLPSRVVIGVTGVATIDTNVANHLVQTVTTARLMGALRRRGEISGRPGE